MKVLVTSQSGFVVSQLREILAVFSDRIEPFFISYAHSLTESNVANQVYDVLLDIGSPTPLNSDNYAETYRLHVNNVTRLHSCLTFKKVYFLSSVSVFGDEPRYVNENTEISISSPYAEMKARVENVHRKCCRNVTTHFLSGMLGKSMPNTFLRRCIEACLFNQEPLITHANSLFNGCYPVDIYCRYLVNQLISENRFVDPSEIIFSHTPMSWSDIYMLICKELGKDVELKNPTVQESVMRNPLFGSLTFKPVCSVSESVVSATNSLSKN